VGTGGLRPWRRSVVALALAGVVAACGGSDVSLERAGGTSPVSADAARTLEVATTTPPSTAPPETAPPAPPPTEPPLPPTAQAPPPPTPREVVETGFAPFAVAEALVLLHPAAVVERVGFHEAGHDGTRHLDAVETTARPIVLESRDRGTGPQTAADIVVPPESEIRSPVTGTVKRAGSYVLYCDNQDDYAVIEPDARPGWEVKVLHISGVRVQAGQRVEAGVTVLAPAPTVLPFASQVDDHTADPAWPHVHVEVVDPSIPDRPNPGGGSSC
jgi:biotin carboxyl carrier protein